MLLTVLAVVLISYEFQLAPVLSLLLPFLHMRNSATAYFVSAALLISAFSAFVGGPLADRYGRVVIINFCLAVITVMVFSNLLIVGIKSFLVIRITMSIVAGLMAGAGAALVRDMSPRLSRALAFGLLTIGPVGSNFLANYIAGVTLPIYQTWQSQMWIMGFLAIAMYIPIFVFLKDLSPELRMKIYQTELAAIELEGGKAATAAELPASAREAFASLLKHFEPWLLVWPFTISLALYIAIQVFGPLMFTESFHYTPGEAAAMNSWFWGGNVVALIFVGLISDGLQMRKPISILGAILTCILLAWWIPTFGEALPRGADEDSRDDPRMLPRDFVGAVGGAVFGSAGGNLARDSSYRMGILRTGDAGMAGDLGATDDHRRGEIWMGGVDQIRLRGVRVLWHRDALHPSDHGSDSRHDAESQTQNPTRHRVEVRVLR